MKTIFFALLTLISFGALAQSTEDGKRLIERERNASAAQTLHQVIQREPSNAEAWYWLAYAYAQQNKASQGLDTLNKAQASLQNDNLFKVALGHLLMANGKKEQAQPLFNAAILNTKEKNAVILSAVARAQIDNKNGDIPYAIGLLQKAIKRDKRNAGLELLIGNAYRKMNNGSEAFQAYQRALQKNKNYAPAFYQLGLIFVTQKNVDMYLDYFDKALAADSEFAPALYQLYHHYFFADASKAMDYFNQYKAKSDPSIEHDYAYTDLLYLNKQYDAAIQNAQQLLKRDDKEPRLYKMLAYSYQAKADSALALDYMRQYFSTEADSNFVMKDYETIADLYLAADGKGDSALVFLEKAVEKEQDSTVRYAYFKKLADIAANLQNFNAQAQWMAKYYTNNPKATNVDLFNWGLAHYRAGDYKAADTVFAKYVEGHPDQGFGYIWQARSKAAMDKEMTEGAAIPYYQKLVEVIGDKKDDETNKKWLVEAYGYLAAYETNTQQDFAEAVDYFGKLLEVDPENQDAKKYMAMLQEKLGKTTKN